MQPSTKQCIKYLLGVVLFAVLLSKNVAAADSKWIYEGGEPDSKTYLVPESNAFSFIVDRPGEKCMAATTFNISYRGKNGANCSSTATLDRGSFKMVDSTEKGSFFGDNDDDKIHVKINGSGLGMDTSQSPAIKYKTCSPDLEKTIDDLQHYRLVLSLTGPTMPEGCPLVLHTAYDLEPVTTSPPTSTSSTDNSTGPGSGGGKNPGSEDVKGGGIPSHITGLIGLIVGIVIGLLLGALIIYLCCAKKSDDEGAKKIKEIQDKGIRLVAKGKIDGWERGYIDGQKNGYQVGRTTALPEGHHEGYDAAVAIHRIDEPAIYQSPYPHEEISLSDAQELFPKPQNPYKSSQPKPQEDADNADDSEDDDDEPSDEGDDEP